LASHPLLHLRHLNKVFHTDELETHALSDISLDLAHGEFVAITGPSGCGKTTLLLILGLLDGDDVAHLNQRERVYLRNTRIGFIFQAFNLIANLTVEENVALPLTFRNDDECHTANQRVREVLKQVGMNHRLRHYPGAISMPMNSALAARRRCCPAMRSGARALPPMPTSSAPICTLKAARCRVLPAAFQWPDPFNGVGVVSAAFAREYLHGEVLGEGLRIPIRVVGDVRQFGPAQPAPPVLYIPLKQIPAPLWAMLREFGPLSVAVRLGGDATGAMEGRLRQAIAVVDPEQPIANVQSMRAVVASTTAVQRMSLLVVGVFSALALLLAAVGLYAVMAVAVTVCRHEFGVYAALGAPAARLLRQVLLESAKQIALGLLIGLAAALALAQMLHGILFGISTADPTALALTLITLAAAGLAASLVPALRAARVEPAQVLRVE